MANLYEKYRPRRLSQLVGQDKAVATVRRLVAGGLGGQALWITGKTGVGKTTLAGILARSFASDYQVFEFASGRSLTKADLDEAERQTHLYGWGKGGKVWIVNEAHGLRAPIIEELLGLLEHLPAHCLFIFTTTVEGQTLFEDEKFDATPLLHRCTPIRLTSQGLAGAFAKLAYKIAGHERLNGKPMAQYVRLLNDCGGSMRGALTEIAGGRMLAGD